MSKMQYWCPPGKRKEERPTGNDVSSRPGDRRSDVPAIFSQSSSSPIMNISISNKKLRGANYWREIKLSKQRISQTIISEVTQFIPFDSRPHATVSINGCSMVRLLDSGATISCFGRNGVERINNLGLKLRPISSSAHTADGTSQSVEVRLYIIPSLTQELYLGYDFWQQFGLMPRTIEELHPVAKKEDVDQNPNSHVLSEDQKHALDKVKSEFLTSEISGLGNTTVLKHHINVGQTLPIKQRYHFVSPAIQSILNSEVDSMLERGIIQESRSAWSSPVIVVKKSDGKMRFCLDCRAVNKVTTKDAYSMPIIDGIFASLHETYFITSIDLKDAFSCWKLWVPLDLVNQVIASAHNPPLVITSWHQ